MKRVVIVLILLLFLSGVQGCAPPPALPKMGGRGLSIEFLPGKPKLSSFDGKLGMETGDDFYVGLNISNPLLKDVDSVIIVRNLARDASNINYEESFMISSAVKQNGRIFPGVRTLTFGPFVYDKPVKMGDSLTATIITSYDGLIIGNMCFANVESADCNLYEAKSESAFGGDAGILPVSVKEVRKEIDDDSVELTVYFRNFGRGFIEENKISNFNLNILESGVSLYCDNEAKFDDKEAKIKCKGSIGGMGLVRAQIEFRFEYNYIEKRTINYIVV